MINEKRLCDTFMALVETDSVSREEGEVAEMISAMIKELGGEITTDTAGASLNSNANNMVAKFSGTLDLPPMLLNAHMDTVEPGRDIKPILADGVFTSAGDTILGADDKSAIAIILEVLRIIKENSLPCPPIEALFTICEEIGLQGAKKLDFSMIDSRFGYTLDTNDTEGIVNKAPAAVLMKFTIFGQDAHAGINPEDGINAILLAAKAIASLEIGRMDNETTCNIGIIEGGLASNIVPASVTVTGEARSHSDEKLKVLVDNIVESFENAVKDYKEEHQIKEDELPQLEFSVTQDFPRTDVPHDHFVVLLAQRAAENLGRKMTTKRTGGGADANILFQKGIITGVLGTGMKSMHSTRESISLADMVKTCELLLEIIRIYNEENFC